MKRIKNITKNIVKNKVKLSKKSKEYSEYNKKYREDNKAQIANSSRNWIENNPHISTWRGILRSALIRMCKYKLEGEHTIDILVYSAYDLKQHMEYLFTEGMAWKNHGEWHIDGKIPLSVFQKETPMSIVNSLENLQPLWSKDNLSKGCKIFEEYKSMDIYIKYCT